MRVRTARAEVRRTEGVEALFDHAVGRHLAWIFGSGHVYKDLIRVSKEHGYRFWVPEAPGDDPVKLWIAVREDLIREDGWVTAADRIDFDSSREDLGSVVLGYDIQPGKAGDKQLVFSHDEDDTVNATNEEGRLESSGVGPLVSHFEYLYTEYTYSVVPLS